MSVAVHIDGRRAESSPTYRAILDALGPVPDESRHSFDLWTSAPPTSASGRSVWLHPQSAIAADDWLREDWLRNGGALIESRIVSDAWENRLRQGNSDVRVQIASETLLDPAVLAAFLTHDFPLVDALMLARAFRGVGWPNHLSDYPVPLGGPRSNVAFPEFPRDAGLYAVVPTSEWAHRLAELDVPVVQLRDKRKDRAQRATSIRDAVNAVSGTHTLLFINDDWQLAIEHGAYGVHLGQEDLEDADICTIRRAGLRLGISTHGIYEMLRAHACRPSYMAMGAIYATATKSMPTSPQGLRRLEHYVRLMSPHYPLVAIGGIDLSRIERIWAAGVDCVAVLRAIVDAADYRRAASELLGMTPKTKVAASAV
jgi:thiamine-phosphate diphosphorylase